MIDSWAWIEYWRGASRSSEAAKFIEGQEDALVSAMNLAEVYHWVLAHYDGGAADAKRASVEARCFVVPVDAAIAVAAARIKKDERLPMADSIVLATGRHRGASVVTGDSDLKGKAGVTYIGP